MAQLLIRLADRARPQARIGAPYRAGDVVDVYPDGQLTVPQAVPDWAVLTVTDLDVDEAKARLVAPDVDEAGVLVRRRACGLDLSVLPASLSRGDRAATVTRDAIRVRDKRTGTTGGL